MEWFKQLFGMANSRVPRIACAHHGQALPAFVCRHALEGSGLGFYAANSPNPDNPIGYEFESSPNGWCGECEKKRIECGGWNDESEAFCKCAVVCIHCFETIRLRNTTGNE